MSDKYYSTSEAAEILNVAPSTLRYWESELKNALNIKRNDNGYRQYTDKDIDLLKKIKTYLYQQKYSIKQVRRILNYEESKQNVAAALLDSNNNNQEILVSSLLEKIEDIENKLDDIKNGQNNLKHEYLQAIKMLDISNEKRDRQLVKEIRKKMNEKKKKHKSLLYKLLPWHNSK